MAIFATMLAVALHSVAADQSDDDSARAKELGRNYNLKEPTNDEEAARPYVMNVKNYPVNSASFQKMAVKAFLRYHWKIEVSEPNRVQGSYFKYNTTYKAEITYKDDKVVVQYVPGFQSENRKWLSNLANSVKRELGNQRREVEAERYLKQ